MMWDDDIRIVPKDGDIWRTMQAAFEAAAPDRPWLRGDRPLFDGGLELQPTELLAFLLALEERLGVRLAGASTPDAALQSVGTLHRHLTALVTENAVKAAIRDA